MTILASIVDPPTSCATKRTGELSDDFIGKQCINLREVDTSNEVKRMIADITGVSTSVGSPGGVWGPGDENALLLWAHENPLFSLPGSVDPGVFRTSGGWHYPSGLGIEAMLEKLGCAPSFGGAQPNCQRYPRLTDWWLRHGRRSRRDVSVDPPMFGAPAEPPPGGGVSPAPPVPGPDLDELPDDGAPTAEPMQLGAMTVLVGGALVGAAVYWFFLRKP